MVGEPHVSVVMPVRNAAGTLVRALESIRRQRIVAWEPLAIDDGSTDGTGAILAAAARDDGRILVSRILCA